MKNILPQEKCNTFERNGQVVISLNSEIMLPENAPVRLVSAQLEELDYRKLYSVYSAKGRKSSVDPQVMFEVIVYGYYCGIYSTRGLEEACRYRVDFMWLLGDNPAPDHATISRFRTGHAKEAIEDLFYQYVRYLEKHGETDHEVVFIDGTKIESRAGRYTFCWRKTVEKNLAKVKEKSGYESLDELSNHLNEAAKEIEFQYGSGHRKSEGQKEWEKLKSLAERWERYEESLAIMGEGRNSYSKTDHDATFMHMKEDHMKNGQLKPGYNVQIGVNSEYITGVEVFSDRTDYKTMKPFMEKLRKEHGKKYEKVTADAGYESIDNYLYLEDNGQICFIKPQNYENQKKHSFKKQIGRIENMEYDAEEDEFTCAEGRKLRLRREETELKDGHFITTAWYRCKSCTGSP